MQISECLPPLSLYLLTTETRKNGSVSRTLHNTFFLVSVRGIFSLQLRNRSMQSVRLFQNFKSDINMYSFTCFDRKISELVSWEITTF